MATAKSTSSAGGMTPDASTSRIGVARSKAGHGDTYETDGSSPWMVFLTKLVGAVIDPVPLAAGAQGLAPINAGWAGMQYDVKLTDHLGAEHSLLHISADLVTSTAVGNFHGYELVVNDSTQRLTAADFTPSLQGGSVVYTLTNPIDYRLRVDLALATGAADPLGGLTGAGGLPAAPARPIYFAIDSEGQSYAQSTAVPEPGAAALLVAGLVVVGWVGRGRRGVVGRSGTKHPI